MKIRVLVVGLVDELPKLRYVHISPDKFHSANARCINGVEFVMVGRDERTIEAPRQSDAESIAQRHFVVDLEEAGISDELAVEVIARFYANLFESGQNFTGVKGTSHTLEMIRNFQRVDGVNKHFAFVLFEQTGDFVGARFEGTARDERAGVKDDYSRCSK